MAKESKELKSMCSFGACINLPSFHNGNIFQQNSAQIKTFVSNLRTHLRYLNKHNFQDKNIYDRLIK